MSPAEIDHGRIGPASFRAYETVSPCARSRSCVREWTGVLPALAFKAGGYAAAILYCKIAEDVQKSRCKAEPVQRNMIVAHGIHGQAL